MFYIREQAIRNFVKCYRKNLSGAVDPLVVLNDSKKGIYDILKDENSRLRFIISLRVTFEKFNNGENIKHAFYQTLKGYYQYLR